MHFFSSAVFCICAYGALKSFRPTEPYLFEFEHVTVNLSAEVLNDEVYPIWTYAYLVMLVPVFILSDLLLYKPVIICEALAYLVCWIFFDLLARSVFTQQLIEFFYGIATATEVAYFAYIYVKVDKEDFKRVTSWTRAAVLVGQFASYGVAQLLIQTGWGTYRTLNYISTGGLAAALLFSLLLPSVSWKDAYWKRFPDKPRVAVAYRVYAKDVLMSIAREIRIIYGDAFIVKWSFWWALTSCMYFQETLLSIDIPAAPVVLLMQLVDLRWSRWGEPLLAVLSVVDGVLLFLQAKTGSIFVMYAAYIVYSIIYEAMLTISQFNLADRLVNDSFGMVFGLNTLIALALQTILTVIVNGHLALAIRPQFLVYSSVHLGIAIVFCLSIAVSLGNYCLRKHGPTQKSISL